MKISLQWLNEFVDIKDYFSHPQELAGILTQAGLEVEKVTDLSAPYKNVVIGLIEKKDQHPNADKLTLCQVQVGSDVKLIVCGANNHKAHDKVVVALPGAVLPGDFVIKVSKIRDVESQGMLCSLSELGMASESEGILILPQEAPVGMPFADYYGLNDFIFEINVTPNRADGLSHIGLAREISTLLKRDLKSPPLNFKKSKLKTSDHLQVELKTPENCPRYAGRLIKNVKVQPSPAWLRNRLENLGLNSINNIVDVTNYVLMELGQPLHAFDFDKLESDKSSNKRITIEASKKEKFKTLLDVELELTGEELTIRDSHRAVALAGVMGGLNTAVDEKTQNIFLESAYFNPSHVRKVSRRFGLHSESSQRFSRGINPEGVKDALDRACYLIEKVCHDSLISEDEIDQYPIQKPQPAVQVHLSTVEQRLGYSVSRESFLEVLQRLNCSYTEASKDSWFVTPPSYRWDLEMEMDFVEEYARIQGYEKIPEIFPVLSVEPTPDNQVYKIAGKVLDAGAQAGFQQAVNYSFIKDSSDAEFYQHDLFSAFGLAASDQPVLLKNPISDDLNVMKRSLLPGLLQNVVNNQRHGQMAGRLFELAPVFLHMADNSEPFKEEYRLSFISWGHTKNLWQKEIVPHVLELKSQLELFLSLIHVSGYQWRPWDEKLNEKIAHSVSTSALHPGQSASLFFQGKTIGFISSLHPFIHEKYKIRDSVAFAEINFEALFKNSSRRRSFQALSKLPQVERDFTFIVSRTKPSQDIAKEIQKKAGRFCVNVSLIDRFEGGSIPEGSVSLTFRVILQNTEKTFSDEELKSLELSIQSIK